MKNRQPPRHKRQRRSSASPVCDDCNSHFARWAPSRLSMAITTNNSSQRRQTRDGLSRQGRGGSVSDRCRRGPRIGRRRASEATQTRVRITPVRGSDCGVWRVFATPTPCLTWCHSNRCLPSGFGAPVTPLSCNQTMAAIRFLDVSPDLWTEF
jgi:hypothetical protein